LEAGEIVKELIVPLPPPRSGSSYQKLSARSKTDIAAVGVSAFLQVDEDEVVTQARIALGAVAVVPKRIPQAERTLEGKKPTDAAIAEAARIAMDEASPITDVRATAAYRKKMVEVLARRALGACLDQIRTPQAGFDHET
jgi:carbon-monoxide dehydrogenase medium subunit